MTTNAVWVKVDPERAWQQEVKIAEGQVVLDFSSVRRIDASVVRALEELAGRNIVLRAVNTDIYKVLKLLKLADRFTFLT
jgi:anti-anti-sigma regulatory factor